MRQDIAADWAFGISGAIQNIVRRLFPADLRNWPLLQIINFDAYQVDGKYLIIILKDQLSGISSGPGLPSLFPYSDHPPLPITMENIELWQSYLRNKFSLREQDAAMIVPLRDSGRNVTADYGMFSEFEKKLWEYQLNLIIVRHKSIIEKSIANIPFIPANITYNVTGQNARINTNSLDSSDNRVMAESPEIFNQLRELLQHIKNRDESIKIEVSIRDMEETYQSPDFISKYQNFITLIANHVTIFAPLLPALAKLLG